jgi:hypothetical protein
VTWVQLDPDSGIVRGPGLPDLHVVVIGGGSVAWFVDAEGLPAWYVPTGDA